MDVSYGLRVGGDAGSTGDGEESSLIVAVSRDEGDLRICSCSDGVEGGLGKEDTVLLVPLVSINLPRLERRNDSRHEESRRGGSRIARRFLASGPSPP